ncbi:ankyrin [Periconia macrospinosa]|uniref:Ankyrin n=1 Tax=Periconia macrospinosa TaxID=97972 RepID=A0A2V1DKC0_9PLEO|nr:ankyrin [Periconia macrospinosa]
MIRYQGWDAAFFDALLDGYPLHLAASHGDVPEIHRLLDTGYNINELHLPRSNQMGFGSALHIAVWCDQTAAFAALLERGANMDILDERTPDERKVEDTPIRLAVRLGRRDMVRKMWRSGAQRHMYAKTSNLADRVTLLEVAAREGYPDIVGDMLSWKSDWTYDQRLNALRKACRAYDVDADAGCTRLLLNDWQYDPEDLEEIACETIIHRVEGGGNLAKVIAALLDEHRGQVMGDNHAHQDLLDLLLPGAAASQSQIESLRLLLQSGADPNAPIKKNAWTQSRFPLQLTLHFEQWDAQTRTFNVEGLKTMLDYGARTDILYKDEKITLENWRRENMGEL